MELKIDVLWDPENVEKGQKTKLIYKIHNQSDKQFTILLRKGKLLDKHGTIIQESNWQPLNIPILPNKKIIHPCFKPKNPVSYYNMNKKGRYFLWEQIKIDGPEGNFTMEKIAELSIL